MTAAIAQPILSALTEAQVIDIVGVCTNAHQVVALIEIMPSALAAVSLQYHIESTVSGVLALLDNELKTTVVESMVAFDLDQGVRAATAFMILPTSIAGTILTGVSDTTAAFLLGEMPASTALRIVSQVRDNISSK